MGESQKRIVERIDMRIRFLSPAKHDLRDGFRFYEDKERGLGNNQGLDQSQKLDRKSTRLNSSHTDISRMPSSA